MTLQPSNPTDSSDDLNTQEGSGQPSLEGFFTHNEHSSFIPPKELLIFGDEPDEYIPRGNFEADTAHSMKVYLAEQMLFNEGRIDPIKLLQLETMLSAAINGTARKQVVQVATGGMLQDDGMENSWLRRMFRGRRRPPQGLR